MIEKIVETKTCRQCNTSFDITQKDIDFYNKVSPVFGGEKILIPTPTLCPKCRQQRRLSFRNERNLYKRKCDATGKEMVSAYAPDNKHTVYHSESWWSDSWSAVNYGRDISFERPFFEQFGKLFLACPHIGSNTVNGENSIYTNFSQDIRDCYMSSRIGMSHDVYYSYLVYNNGQSCVDCYNLNHGENCYEVVDSKNCFDCRHCYHCFDGTRLFMCSNCYGCQDCFASYNLQNQKYVFFNKQYSKEEYQGKVEEWFKKNDTTEKVTQVYKDIRDESIGEINFNENCENCLGYKLTDSKNIFQGTDCTSMEDATYISGGIIGNNHYDTDFTHQGEMMLEQMSCGKTTKTMFSLAIFDSHNVIYSYYCHGSSHIFGCVGLKNKSYCILNKQYTKEQYEKIVPKIIEHMKKTGEWGEFFPPSMSPFGYRETVAMDYFPMKERDIQMQGWNNSHYEVPFPQVDKIIDTESIPIDIQDIPDDILNWAIKCEVTQKPFRIIAQELEFYRKHTIPIPRKHPDQRHLDRIELRKLKI